MSYLIFINILSAVACAFDKFLAIKKKYRLSEKILLGFCIIGGVFGFALASQIVRHKTKDEQFLIYMYPILIIWIFVLVYLNL